MKILFVSSGIPGIGPSPIIKNQAQSLIKSGLDVELFPIYGTGFSGYLKSVGPIRKKIKEYAPDVVHAHYSLSAFAASLARSKPLVVSLMGSDVKAKKWFKNLIKLFNYFFWSTCIVKSDDMKKSLGIEDVQVIPNGVDFDFFKPANQEESQKLVGWDRTKKHILFPANPKRREKNFQLAEEAVNMLKNNELELHYLENIPNNMMVTYYNACDVLISTSLWEGSPNAVKEAMACNIPIVSTEVGDIREILGETNGCYLTSFAPDDVSEKLRQAINFGKRTNGRENITYLKAALVAEKLTDIYKKLING